MLNCMVSTFGRFSGSRLLHWEVLEHTAMPNIRFHAPGFQESDDRAVARVEISYAAAFHPVLCKRL